MEVREAKALELVERGRVVPAGDGAWLAFSLTSTERYEVRLSPESCTCGDFETTHSPCKHVIAARILASRKGFNLRPADPPPQTPPAVWPRPSYSQD